MRSGLRQNPILRLLLCERMVVSFCQLANQRFSPALLALLFLFLCRSAKSVVVGAPIPDWMGWDAPPLSNSESCDSRVNIHVDSIATARSALSAVFFALPSSSKFEHMCGMSLLVYERRACTCV